MALETIQEKNQAFITAVAERKLAFVKDILRAGADIHYNDDLALRSAVYMGHLDMVTLLLDNGANVHADGEVALFSAIKAHDADMVEKLLEKGASLQAVLARRSKELDAESLAVIDQIQSRSSKAVFEKNFEAFRKRPKPSGGLKPKSP